MRIMMARMMAVCGLAVAVGVGCSGQRPLDIVKSSAEFNAEHGNYAEAKKDFEEYIRRKPEAVDVRYEHAKALIAAGEPRAAMGELNTCLDVFPMNDDYLDALAQAMYDANERDALTALLARNASERGRVSDFVRQGVYAWKIGNVDEAQQALKTAAKLDNGEHLAPYRILADFYGSLHNRPMQVRALRMAYAIQPANKDTLAEIRRIGEIPGPSFALRPSEITLPGEGTRETKVEEK